MNFLVLSNDQVVYSTLTEIIENNNFGDVIISNSTLRNCLLAYKKIDILIIDSLAPVHDSLQELHSLLNSFSGKTIIISQIKDKATIAQAYFLGVEYYIFKPIHQFEVIAILKKVIELHQLEKYICNIKNTLKIF